MPDPASQSNPSEMPAPGRCQWCFADLPAGVTRCPACGSPAVPDLRMRVPGFEEMEREAHAPDALTIPSTGEPVWLPGQLDPEELEERGRPRVTLTYEDVETRRLQTLGFIAVAVVVCTFIGWLVAPALLQGPMESLTGTPVENPDDLRGMGGFIGLLVGFMVGATGGWIIWASR